MEALGGSDLLWNVLGTALGFVTVMLILSLIVTVMVQFLQSLFRIRARNLVHGLNAALNAVEIKADDREEITNDLTVSPLAKTAKLVKPRITYIPRQELHDKLTDHKLVPPDKVKKVMDSFARAETYISKRFLLVSRFFSFASAFLVAFFFQVSAIDLLHDLATDAEMREAAATAAEVWVDRAPDEIAAVFSYDEVNKQALDTLKARHPDYAAQIDAAAGAGGDHWAVETQLMAGLTADSVAERGAIIEEYRSLLDEYHSGNIAAALQGAREMQGSLGAFNIQFMGEGWDYYSGLGHWLGILMTAILLSMGAPFWFKMLQEVMALRDLLGPSKKQKEAETSG